MPDRPGNIIRFTTSADGADEFAAVLDRAVEHVNAETGTTTWFAGRSETDGASFVLVDLFADEEARNAHFAGPAAQLIVSEGGPLLEGQPEIMAVQLLAGKNV
jgi:quinol monooxygenase YgiN